MKKILLSFEVPIVNQSPNPSTYKSHVYVTLPAITEHFLAATTKQIEGMVAARVKEKGYTLDGGINITFLIEIEHEPAPEIPIDTASRIIH